MYGVRLAEWLHPFARSEAVDWEAVYREELSRVHSFFRYRTASREAAEDLTSATFEKAWRARHRYRAERAAVSTWLLAIARNVAIDHFRKSRPEVSLGGSEPAATGTPELEAQRRSERQRLASLLAGLPARERELLALKYGAADARARVGHAAQHARQRHHRVRPLRPRSRARRWWHGRSPTCCWCCSRRCASSAPATCSGLSPPRGDAARAPR